MSTHAVVVVEDIPLGKEGRSISTADCSLPLGIVVASRVGGAVGRVGLVQMALCGSLASVRWRQADSGGGVV